MAISQTIEEAVPLLDSEELDSRGSRPAKDTQTLVDATVTSDSAVALYLITVSAQACHTVLCSMAFGAITGYNNKFQSKKPSISAFPFIASVLITWFSFFVIIALSMYRTKEMDEGRRYVIGGSHSHAIWATRVYATLNTLNLFFLVVSLLSSQNHIFQANKVLLVITLLVIGSSLVAAVSSIIVAYVVYRRTKMAGNQIRI